MSFYKGFSTLLSSFCRFRPKGKVRVGNGGKQGNESVRNGNGCKKRGEPFQREFVRRISLGRTRNPVLDLGSRRRFGKD